MRWACVMVLSLLIGCASSQPPSDVGTEPDLSIGHCDAQQLFAACSDQCHEPVCIVAAAQCEGTQWICDCSKVGPCPTHD
jgi:hypothetical protein